MDGMEKIILSKVHQIQKDKSHLFSFTGLGAPRFKFSDVKTYSEMIAESRKVKSDYCWNRRWRNREGKSRVQVLWL